MKSGFVEISGDIRFHMNEWHDNSHTLLRIQVISIKNDDDRTLV